MDAGLGMQKIKKLEHVFERQLCKTYKNFRIVEAIEHQTKLTKSVLALNREESKLNEKNRHSYRSLVVNKINIIR